jgi:phenylpyruvate tautomerase PptA (4-oxalocrotonate tautomerase family)
MPLVRIDIKKQQDPTFARRIGKVVYQSMRSAIGVPEKDNFQVLAEHDENHLVYDPSYLDIPRTDGVVFIQITLNEGRATEKKQLLYKTIADGLNQELKIRREDVFINLVEVKAENWSFGNGVAQYVK